MSDFVYWDLVGAINFIREIRPRVVDFGYEISLGASPLLHGYRNVVLDLIALPIPPKERKRQRDRIEELLASRKGNPFTKERSGTEVVSMNGRTVYYKDLMGRVIIILWVGETPE